MIPTWSAWIIAMALAIAHQMGGTGATRIGVCYGRVGDNLPPPEQVVNLFKKSGIGMMRIFDPEPTVLNALRGSGILVAVGTKNEDLPSMATNPQVARDWIKANFVPYTDVNITWISAGNEVIPGDLAFHVPNAMQNLYNALVEVGRGDIKVTTVLPATVLGVSYPPSQGAFTEAVIPVMGYVLAFLTKTKSPLMINVYPYFAYASNPKEVPLDYAQFADHAVVHDGDLGYYSLFDAIVDSFYSAMDRLGGANIDVIVSESGWPSAGTPEPYTSPSNAMRYNTRLRDRLLDPKNVKTPKRPNATLDTFFFAMFNEDKKPAGIEQNFGFFYPDMKPVYSFWP